MTIRVYRSTDSGAPAMDGLGGSLLSVLTGCLVTGYGNRAAAGWSLAYESGNVGVYVPGMGSRFYLQIDDRVGRSSFGGRVAGVRIYETMSSADAGIDPIPSEGERYIAKSTASSSDARAWILIADEQAFYLFNAISSDVLDSSINYQRLSFFGRLRAVNISDAWAVGVAASTYDNTGSNGTGSQIGRVDTTPINSLGIDVQRGFSGVDKSSTLTHMVYLGSNSGLIGYRGYVAMDGDDDWLLYPAPVMHDSSAVGFKRALMPGLWTSMGRTQDHDDYGQTGLLIDGPTGESALLGVSFSQSGQHAIFFIDLVEWGRV